MNSDFAELTAHKKVCIVDTTLRDGEQTPGVAFSLKEKMHIATLLDEIGVEQIEAGTPVMGGDETAAVKAIAKAGLKASIMAWNRARISDIEASIACGVDAVEVSCSTSDIHIRHKLRSSQEKVLEDMVTAVEFARRNGLYVSVGAEDATRSDINFVIRYAQAAKQAGAHRLRYCDTVGVMDPLAVYQRVEHLRENVALDIEIHTHNDFGMATANSIAAFRAGARFISTTVGGLGERAGNAALEEVIMALKHSLHCPAAYKTAKLRHLCEYTATAAGRQLPGWKAVTGADVFAFESGIHADGTLKNPSTYEPFEPKEVGLTRRLVIGKHSGSAALINKYRELGVHIDKAAASQLLPHIRALAVSSKKPPSDAELLTVYREITAAPAVNS